MPMLIRTWKTISKFSNGHGNISEMKDDLLYNNIKRKKIHDPTQFGTGFEIPSKIL